MKERKKKRVNGTLKEREKGKGKNILWIDEKRWRM